MNIQDLKKQDHKILAVGSYPAIIQSMLDFDYLSGKDEPSVAAIIAGGRKFERYFFGKKEVVIPVFNSITHLPEVVKNEVTLFLNLSSGRRVLTFSEEALQLPKILGGVVFAEDVPEEHALSLYRKAKAMNKFMIGPASVGLLIPGNLKLGAIGGVDWRQLGDSKVFTAGNVAVFSASGGMTNEIIRIVATAEKRLSFSLAFGGDRFPMMTPQDAFELAQNDPDTDVIVYFGELGGTDEYALAESLKSGKISKKVIAYIAGVISDFFEEPPQFGHAKAMAKTADESAHAKRKVLQEAGASVPESFTEFVEMIKSIDAKPGEDKELNTVDLTNRKPALISSSVSGDIEGVATVLGEDLLTMAKNNSFASIVSSMFLGQKIKSTELEAFVDFVLRLLVDHGPYVSGAVNTIITARAGKDLPASLAAGLLTVGPRFGGAINEAANNWLKGVSKEIRPIDFVEGFASRREYISGIGHRKYRVDLPDPRVVELLKFADSLEQKRFSTFAKEVENVTVSKKGNLILNVDGAIAAVLLDMLSEKEGYTDDQLTELVKTEFFNALFVLSRSVGFISHFLDQKRLDEGLFRLPDNLVADIGNT
jgi:succinyl-CoA synthetase alpha subunit